MLGARRLLSRLRTLFRQNRAERELAREVASHLTLLADDFERRGMSPEEARLAARRAYGAVEQAKQAHRDERSLQWMEQAIQDVRYALRMLRKSPGFAAVVILTLALGIGANTAIFSVIDAVMFRALPVADPQLLVIFSWTAHHKPKHLSSSSYGDCAADCFVSMPFFEAVRAQTNSFSGVAAFAGPPQIDLSGNGPASIADGQYVSGDYFNLLGLKTVFGRPLGPADDTPSAPPAIVLDYRYWQRAFGANPAAVGRTVRLNNVEALIVGVADPRFTGLTPGKTQDFFMPISLVKRVRSQWWDDTQDRLGDPNIWWVVVVGRLKPGVTVAQAQAQASNIFRNETLHGAKPLFAEADAPAIKLLPAREGLNGESNEIAPMLKLIMAAVGFVLLIACANVAGLILARSTKRQKEIAVRQALGARRARIARQLLTESLLLSVAGGALGIVVAFWGVHALTKLLSSGFDESFPFVIATDWRVLAFTSGVTLLTGILAGLAPTLSTARLDLTPALRENTSSLPGESARYGRGFRLGDVLVVAQVALSIVVLAGAGLLVRTLRNLETLNPGFDTHNILLFAINPTMAGYKDRQTADLYRDLQQRFAALPGVLSVSYSEEALLSGSESSTGVHLDGAPHKSNLDTNILPVGLDFLSAMRIPLRGGRALNSADFASASETRAAVTAADELASKARTTGAAPAAATAVKPSWPPTAPVPVIVNQTFVRKYLSGRDPLGLHMG
ncbi:MAG: ABC transporter permease, partial [Terracidiphilus sp.]